MLQARDITAMSGFCNSGASIFTPGRLPGRKADLSFRDIIAAEGRNEATRQIRRRLADADKLISEKRGLEREATDRMTNATNKKQADELWDFFYDKLSTFAYHLGVRLDHAHEPQLSSIALGCGSEGPRGIITYDFAFPTYDPTATLRRRLIQSSSMRRTGRDRPTCPG